MMKAFSRTRSRKELLTIHMKFVLFVIIAILFWNSNGARQVTAESFTTVADFISPETK
jgi:hypothetical protein|tara:strand:+ start:547 stop:720 length:174 start_codon:yes stop_codon:yes gene_type:complete